MKKLFLVLLLFSLFALRTVYAEEETKIYTYEDLLQVQTNPNGNYVLMQDIDMKGKQWSPKAFFGTFDGNNHVLLNLNITSCDSETRKTYDGNMIGYDTSFSGFFSILEKANVKNLNLINTHITINSSSPTFIGALSGYSDQSTIENCTLDSRIQLDTTAASFGVGGAIGFGNGVLKDSTIQSTIVEVDQDKVNKDEQFLGGVLAAGYLDIDSCSVTINGYDSDHGYVHNGGMVGMYIIYTEDKQRDGFVTNNTVNGQITFFEDNEDRRAYCEEYIGEIMHWSFAYTGNTSEFSSNETFTYDKDLTDEEHTDGFITKTIESTHDAYGYTEYTCKKCNHTWKDDYTLQTHHASSFTPIIEADFEHTGLEEGLCDTCSKTIYQEIPKEMPVENISFQATHLELKVDEEYQLKLNVTPSDVSAEGNYTSSDEEVIQIDENGLLKALKPGSAIITFQLSNQDKKAEVNIEVIGSNVLHLSIIFVLSIFAIILLFILIRLLKRKP